MTLQDGEISLEKSSESAKSSKGLTAGPEAV